MNAEDHDAPYVSHPNLTLQLTLRPRKRERAQANLALDLMKSLMLSAGIWREKSTGYVSPGDHRPVRFQVPQLVP